MRNKAPILAPLVALSVYFSLTTGASAYIGPGMAAGTVGVIIGVIGSIFLALFAILYYPIKRMLKNKKSAKAVETENKEPK